MKELEVGDQVRILIDKQIVSATIMKIGKNIFGYTRYLCNFVTSVRDAGEHLYDKNSFKWVSKNKII